ncbi:glutathione S-transferase family protein [Pacificimonas sp. WHA3]|uniref:Glutathione S-transferase family protein n=1 Tax=Pacificimonas pallii TaxID=2827236 RepID=A0ABS6SFQ8_9SPHN|nr:glutathione S-transferase family protein [Pacificimonas pallii]MBV7257085.1 glutathione S-transferase family protein [Pacificimonas pallii]
MRLYNMKAATNPRRVRIFLAEKGVEIPMVDIDIMSGENRSDAYLAINPRGTLPALELDDGTVIDESVAICRYIEALHPEPPLFGTGALGQAQVEQWQRRVELDGFFNVAGIFRNIAPQFATRAAPGAAPDTKQIPELAERSRALLPRFFSIVDAQLAEHEFIAGETYSIADITLFCTIGFARWVKIGIPDDCRNLNRWNEAMLTRPSAKA